MPFKNIYRVLLGSCKLDKDLEEQIVKKNLGSEKNGYEIELPHSVGIVYSDVQRAYFPTEEQYITEKDADEDARLIANYLESLALTVFLYPGTA